MDLESLKNSIKEEIRRLDQRRQTLLENMTHLRALESRGEKEGNREKRPTPVPEGVDDSAPLPEDEPKSDELLAGLRCLKCGSSLRNLIPSDSKGRPIIGSPRLGNSSGGDRYLECLQCGGKNLFLRTTGPRGWRLLVTQLRQ